MYDTFNMFTGDTLAYYAQRCHSMYMAWLDTSVHTTFKSLFYYMQSKLMWDTSLDEEELMNNWFRAMFKDAAPMMQSMFFDMRTHAAVVYSENNLYCKFSCYNKVENKNFWPIATLKQWISICDKALLAIEDYKTSNPSMYQTLKNHIDAESISPIYILLKLYEGELSLAEKSMLCNRILDMQNYLPMELVSVNASAVKNGDLLKFVKELV